MAYAVFALGFWLLYQGFSKPSAPLGILGGATVPLAMYLMVLFRKFELNPLAGRLMLEENEVEKDDSLG